MPNPIVIKFGGSLLEDKTTRNVFLRMLAKEWKIQRDLGPNLRSMIIVVHGGGKDISKALETAGIKPKFVEGRRFTDEKTMEIVERVLKTINKNIIDQLKDEGAQAWGGCGKTNHLLEARPLSELGRVGIPSVVNKKVVNEIVNSETLPVLYSVAFGPTGETLNINADDFAQEVAIACAAEHLIFMTDTGGIRNKNGELMEIVNPKMVENLISDGTISGGMEVKARACIDALNRGVRKVTITHQIDSLGSTSTPRAFGTSFVK